jgi:hypothetical protein
MANAGSEVAKTANFEPEAETLHETQVISKATLQRVSAQLSRNLGF